MRHILEKPSHISHDPWWLAHLRRAPITDENSSKALTRPQELLLGFVFYIKIRFSESGEGVVATVTTTYGYDYSSNRVTMATGGTGTTTYPSKFYNVQGATTTKHIFLGNELE